MQKKLKNFSLEKTGKRITANFLWFWLKNQSGTRHHERTDSQKASRNDYKPRTILTKYGELELLKSQFREFSIETQVFEKYSRVKKIMTILGIEGISAFLISRITKELDEKVCEFLSKLIENENEMSTSILS